MLVLTTAGCAEQTCPPFDASRLAVATEALQATVIDVNPADALKSVSPALFGVNHRYVDNALGTWNPSAGDCEPAFNDVVDYMQPTVMRYPGGLIGNLFDWKRAVAGFPQSGKKQIQDVGPGQQCNFGIHEALGWAATHGMDTTYCFGTARASVQDAADLVEYLNAPNDGSNWGGGEDFAAKRAANGHPAPFDVRMFELGNEPWVDPSLVDEKYWMLGRSLSGRTDAQQYALGDTVAFDEPQPAVMDEDWSDAAARSTGTAGQVKYTRYHPVQADTQKLWVGSTPWTEVANWDQSSPSSTHYIFDDATGRVSFGDGVRGMIPPNGSRITLSYATTRPGFKDFYAAMKAVDPSIEIYSSYSDPAFVQAMGAQYPYDGMVMHQYPTNTQTIDDRRHNENMLSVEAQAKQVEAMQAMIRAAGGSGAAQRNVAVTEFSLYAGPVSTFPVDYLRSLDSALYTAQQLMEYMKLGVKYAHRHALVDDRVGHVGRPDFALVNSPYYVVSASALVYAGFNQMFGRTLVRTSITGNPERTIWDGRKVPYLKTVAAKDASGSVYVWVVNRDQANSCVATVRFSGAAALTADALVWQINGPSYKSFNDIFHPNDVELTSFTAAMDQATVDVEFPAHSITMIRVGP